MEKQAITILIIDDNFANDEPLVIELSEIYQQVLVKKPQQSLKYIKAHLNDSIIVLLDIMMPKLNGHEVLTEIRKVSFLIPVILFSAINEDRETFSDFINNKVDAFIKKDASTVHILKVIDKVAITLSNQVDKVLEQWILKHPEEKLKEPYIANADGKVYTLSDILHEVRMQSDVGKQMAQRIQNLTIDLITRGKKQL